MKFDDIQVGDQVIIPRGNHGVVATVERVTKTQFIAGGERFMKDGAKYGTSADIWHSRYARHATPEAVDRLNILNRYDKFYNFVNRAAKVIQYRLT